MQKYQYRHCEPAVSAKHRSWTLNKGAVTASEARQSMQSMQSASHGLPRFARNDGNGNLVISKD